MRAPALALNAKLTPSSFRSVIPSSGHRHESFLCAILRAPLTVTAYSQDWRLPIVFRYKRPIPTYRPGFPRRAASVGPVKNGGGRDDLHCFLAGHRFAFEQCVCEPCYYRPPVMVAMIACQISRPGRPEIISCYVLCDIARLDVLLVSRQQGREKDTRAVSTHGGRASPCQG